MPICDAELKSLKSPSLLQPKTTGIRKTNEACHEPY
jgi:hypothetical protein